LTFSRLVSDLRKILRGQVRANEPLSEHTTLRIGGPADLYCVPADEGDAVSVLSWAAAREIPLYVLGGGSNLLVADEGVRGLVLRTLPGLGGLEFFGCVAEAGAGLPLPLLLRSLFARGLAGGEALTGVPGTVGGAICMNAGTSRGCLADLVREVRAWNPELGKVERISGADCRFEYRTSCFQRSGHVVLSAGLEFTPGDPRSIRRRARDLVEYRRRTQPRGVPSAGSVFRNPPGDSAGRLIDEAGCKGWTVGGAAVSSVHGNFIVNGGGASSRHVMELVGRVRRKVEQQFGVGLQLELTTWGVVSEA